MSNPNFYLTANKQIGTWDDGELRLLCKALRFPEDLIVSYTSQSFVDGKIATSKLRSILQQNAFFRLTDSTFNSHSADWNIPALLRSIDIVEGRMASFAELHAMFLAYATYELPSMVGLPADVETVLSAFKLCGKTISPAKLRHRLKHAKVTHVRPNAIQFDEFLNLLLWTVPDNFPTTPELFGVKEQDGRELYRVDHPSTYMIPSSERTCQTLDRQFVNDEMSYASKQVRFGPKSAKERRSAGQNLEEFTSALQVDAGISQNVVKVAKAAGKIISSEITASAQEIRQVAAGFDHMRDISREWLIRETTPKPSPSSPGIGEGPILSIPDLGGATATEMYEILQAYMRERECRLRGDKEVRVEKSWDPPKRNVTPRKAPRLLEPIVTQEDITETQESIKSLKIDYGFMQRQRLLEEANHDDDSSDTAVSRRPIDELTQQLYNPPPLRFQSHDLQCDSRKRNIGLLNKPGVHVLLTEPCYDERSPQGKFLAQLHSDLTENGRLRGKTVRIVNSDTEPKHDHDIAIKITGPDQKTSSERAGTIGRPKTPPNETWMAIFAPPSYAAQPVDLEHYYWRKMDEYGVKQSSQSSLSNKTPLSIESS